MTKSADLPAEQLPFPVDSEKERGFDPSLPVEGEDAIKSLVRSGHVPADGRFQLKLEAWLLKLTHAHHKIMSLSNSRTRILAHQVESTHRIVNSLTFRYLIADEVGLGKTVEAGLVIKELYFRFDYSRVLIVCPASIQSQWQQEMESKFNERFTVVDRKELQRARRSAGKKGNPWMCFEKSICSIDFIKSRSMAEDIKKSDWDIVVFDEAHRLRRDSRQSTLAYGVAEVIARRTKALLLLSATPFRGKLEELYFLVSLIDKNILGPFHTFYRRYCIESGNLPQLKGVLAPVIIRRTKKEVGGFTNRFAKTVRFELYPNERLLYDEATRYVIEEFNRAMADENRAVGFVMTVFQKLLDSSSYALHRALENRLGRLQENLVVLRNAAVEKRASGKTGPNLIDDIDPTGDLGAQSRKDTEAEMQREIETLQRLVLIAANVGQNKKGEKLLDLLKRFIKKEKKKVIIFTQFMTTQHYLAGLLSEYRVTVFNGTMGRDEKDRAVTEFKERTDIFISTEAGGEGRNLQFCNVMVNYDLPWSPLKIEQRIGRIHRFGQADDVYIYNFATRDTVAERILEILTMKLQVFEESIGAMDVLLGQIEEEVDLNRVFMEMAAGRKSRKEVEHELELKIRDARVSYEKLSELTVSHRLDFNYDEYYRVTLKERRFSSKCIEEFVNRLARIDDAGAAVAKRRGETGIYDVRDHGSGKCLPGTFDSTLALEREDLQFLAFGHPVINGIIGRVLHPDFGGLTGTVTVRSGKSFTGMVLTYRVSYASVAETEEIVPVVVGLRGSTDSPVCDELEEDIVHHAVQYHAGTRLEQREVNAVTRYAERLFALARVRLAGKIKNRITAMEESMDVKLYPEIQKIRTSYDDSIAELTQKLEIQESRMKWYGEDLRGAITRTRNSIRKSEKERNEVLERYAGYGGIKCGVVLIGAAIIRTLQGSAGK